MRSLLFAAAALFAFSLLMPAFGQGRQGRRTAAGQSGGKDSVQKTGKTGVTLGGKALPVLISKHSFDSVANLRLVPVESGAMVTEFQFTYGEHKLYEDSLGNPVWMMDLKREYCAGDVINSTLKEFLPAHSKSGDSAWFESIYVKRKDGSIYLAPPLTFAIRR